MTVSVKEETEHVNEKQPEEKTDMKEEKSYAQMEIYANAEAENAEL